MSHRMFRLVRLVHLLLQGVASLGGVWFPSHWIGLGHLLFVPPCLFAGFAFFEKCVVFSTPFSCFPFMLFSFAVVPQRDTVHGIPVPDIVVT